MKRFLVPAAALALLAGAAYAQTAAPAGHGAGPAPIGDMQRDAAGGPPPPPPGGPGLGGPGLGAPGLGGPDMDGPGAGGPGHRLPPPPPPPPSKAPHVRIDRGTLHLDVKCGDDDSIKVCSDAAASLLDKIRSLPAEPAPQDGKAP